MIAKSCNTVDIVIPLYNEELGLVSFNNSLWHILLSLPYECRVFYVNDGSTDSTSAIIESLIQTHDNIFHVCLSRNFGHQAALTAGLELADADIIISMDGDGQHPPDLIPDLIRNYLAGNDVVLTHRKRQDDVGRFKRISSRVFYALLNVVSEIPIQPSSSDFRLISRNALAGLRRMPEYHRFLRGLVPWLGFSTTTVSFDAPKRIAGVTSYTFGKMLRLAFHAVMSFSHTPLRFAPYSTLAWLGLVIGAGLKRPAKRTGPDSINASQSRTLLYLITFACSIILISQTILSSYMGFVWNEVRRRPIYIIDYDNSFLPRNK